MGHRRFRRVSSEGGGTIRHRLRDRGAGADEYAVRQFGAGLDHAVPMPEYDDTPAGDVRRAIASNSFAIRGDAGKTVAAMIVAADSAHPPLRLTLGGGAYDSIRASLAERLRVLEAKDIAFSADSIS